MNTPAQTPITVPNDNSYKLTTETGGGGNAFALYFSETSVLSLAVVAAAGEAGRDTGVIAGGVMVNH